LGCSGATVFENMFHRELVLTVAQTSLYAQQYIYACSINVGAQFIVRKWETVTVNELYVIIALFMLVKIIEKPTL
jgi:hypothetical protein